MTLPAGWQAHDYRGEQDLLAMRTFLAVACGSRGPAGGYWHVGDATWAVFLNQLAGPVDRGRFWTGPDGAMAGFAWTYKGEAEIQIDPALTSTPHGGALLKAMVDWLAERQRNTGESGPLAISASAADTFKAGVLAPLGFRRDPTDALLILRRDLTQPIPNPALPPGFTIRPIRVPDEILERAAIHQEVWHPSRVTPEGIARLQTMPGFDPALDLVAVAPDGRFAAYATAWWDPITRSGEFEPVGTRAAFRGQRLATAVLNAGMQTIRARGGETMWVYGEEENPAAIALYTGAGFEEVDRTVRWMREATG